MHRLTRVSWSLLFAACGLVLVGNPTSAQRIGLFFDESHQVCSFPISADDPPYQGRLWVFAFFDDLAGPPVVGTHFRIAGLPAGLWGYGDRPDLITGADGRSIAWGQRDFDRVVMGFLKPIPRAPAVLLWVIDFFPNGMQVPETVLRIETPDMAASAAPILVALEDAVSCSGEAVQEYVMVAASSGQEAVLNGECTVAVQDATWESIKRLYR